MQTLTDPDIEAAKTETIRKLNDLFRGTFLTGRLVITQGVQSMPPEAREILITKVREFNAFTPDNDPHGEHDFGQIELFGEKFFWKIDYYDAACEYGSENPADPKQTTRVLTILRADEY